MYRMGWLHILFLILYGVPVVAVLWFSQDVRVTWSLLQQAALGFGAMLPGIIGAPLLAYKVDAWLLDREFRRRYPAA
jgi:hypothetical protein